MNDTLPKGLTPLTINEVKKEIENETIVLDTRSPEIFTQGFIPGSINIGLDDKLADYSSSLLKLQQPIILVAEKGKEKEAIALLLKAGFDKLMGYAAGGFEAWKAANEPIDLIIDIEADELAMDLPFDENLLILDVRKPNEFAEGHVKDAQNIPLDELTDLVNIANFEEEQNIYIHSGSGYRSVIAASLLKRQGVHNLRNVVGGWEKIKEEKKIKTEKDSSALN